jgi:hypothetical protein
LTTCFERLVRNWYCPKDQRGGTQSNCSYNEGCNRVASPVDLLNILFTISIHLDERSTENLPFRRLKMPWRRV